jgi:methionyl-tRNA formyltransferase
MNIAFFGTPPFTTEFLDTLSENGFLPSLIVTNPDRPSGRGMKLTSPLPKIWGDQHNISVLQPERIDESFIQELKQQEWDLFIVIAYGHILPEKLITLPRLGTLNVHYSLLPLYRGATPIESAILHGDEVTGVSIQQMRYKLDSGPILAQEEIAITATDTTPSLREKMNQAAKKLLPEVITSLKDGAAHPVEQDNGKATFCTKIKKEDGLINLADEGIINNRKFRAYTGSIGIFFMHENARIKIKSAHLDGGHFVIDTVVLESGKTVAFNTLDII